MHSSKWPERSYWECQWTFPKTGTVVEIAIQGGESGPLPEARQFYLSLAARYERISIGCRPRLEQVFNDWLHRPLPQDIFTIPKLAGFGLEGPKEQPVRCDVGFETIGDSWLGITIPFVGETAMAALVDTE